MPRLDSELTDLLMFLDNEVDSIHQALTMAATRCREAATQAREDFPESAYARLFEESAETWERKAARLLDLAEHLPDVLGY